MAEAFMEEAVAEKYADGRPGYPADLFKLITSKTPAHHLVWDVGTANGQAARSLAGIFTSVIATDISQKQLDLAPKLPNIIYRRTPPTMSIAELEQNVAPAGTLDLVTIGQALHWFDLTNFYRNVRWALKKPHGVVAAWCCLFPQVSGSVDNVLRRMLAVDLKEYRDGPRRIVEEEYRTIEFPFLPVDGEDDTGPFEFAAEKVMDLEKYLSYMRSWSAYQTAKEKGVELLTGDVMKELEGAWNEDGNREKVVKFPVFLRMGKVGSMERTF